MLVFDQLKRNDVQLQVITAIVLSGILVLLTGLWWVQVFSFQRYSENQKAQAFRTVRIPAIRGKILDRNGVALAENEPSYNVNIYIDELRDLFREEYKRSRPKGKLTRAQKLALESDCHYRAVSNVVQKIGEIVGQPLFLYRSNFFRHYTNQLALPFPVLRNLTPAQVARLQEHPSTPPGVDLEVQPFRHYPYNNTAAHILGYLSKDNSSAEGEDAFFNFRLPDYRGRVGIEGALDQHLRGKAGMKSVLVNSLGYRQSETVWNPAEPGKNVVLTIDRAIQESAEKALRTAPAPYRGPVRGAVVVMDPHTGNILAMASSPSFDPNSYIRGMSYEEYAKLEDENLRPQVNRATRVAYPPGSIFKIVVSLACLDAGLDPLQPFYCPQVIWVGRRAIKDPQGNPNGDYDFRHAFMKSSNSYFITNGIVYGPQGIIRLGEQFHFGERTPFEVAYDVGGSFPRMKDLLKGWSDGDTANIAIGQGPIDLTLLQVAVMVSAVANGGKVLYPRLVERIVAQDPVSGEPPIFMPGAKVRDQIRVQPHSLEVVREAMLADVEDPEGTGKKSFVPGLRVCGKTGTAQLGESGKPGADHITWFASFAPYENPRYVVVVMIESGASGGGTCAPVAGAVYRTIHDLESAAQSRAPLVAEK